MSGALKIETLILILIAGILFTSSTLMPLANAQPTPTSLTITVPYNSLWGKECTMKATLLDENDNPLQNFDIDFLYGCNTHTHPDHWHLLGTTKTDSNGVASLTCTFPVTTTFNVTATFSGTSNYASSSSEYVDIIIIDYTAILVGFGLLIAVAIMGVVRYIVFRRRKKATTIPKTTKEA